MRASSIVLPAFASIALLYGCASNTDMPMQHSSTSLYDRLGGRPAITAVVNDFVGNVAADNRINGFFARTDIPRLKRLLVEQICAGTGGPCRYTGGDMKTAHAGMGVTDSQFTASTTSATAMTRASGDIWPPSRRKG